MNTWEQFVLVQNRGTKNEMMFFSGGMAFIFRHAQVSGKKKRRQSASSLLFTSAHLALISHYSCLVPGAPSYRKWYCVISLADIVLAQTLHLLSLFPYNTVMTNQCKTKRMLRGIY